MRPRKPELFTYLLLDWGPRSGLRFRLMSFLAAVWLVVFLLIGASVMFFVYSTEATAWRGRQSEAALNAANTVASFVWRADDTLALVGLLGRDEVAGDPQQMERVLQQNTSIQEIVYIDTAGEVIAGASRDQPLLANLFTIPQSQWFLTARAGQEYHGSVQFSAGDEPYVIIARADLDQGVTAARLTMGVLWDVVAHIRFGQSGKVYVATRAGQIIAHTDHQIVLANTNVGPLSDRFGDLREPGDVGYAEYSDLQGGAVVGVMAMVPGTDWVVVTELPQSEAFAATRTALLVLVGGMLILVLLTVWTTRRFLERMIFQPMEARRTGSERIGAGDLTYRIDLVRRDEVGQVAEAFNRMAHNLQQRNAELATNALALFEEVGVRREAEDALRKLNEQLEGRVLERTTDLAQANEQLRVEIGEREQAEERVKTSLHEKEILLKEIHHRVKNNLQIISSLLNLQSSSVTGDAKTLEVFRDSQHRVRSMALIHEKLYRSDNLAQIDFGEYVRELASFLFRSHNAQARRIQLNADTDRVFLGIDAAVPSGLILNELVSNALKHAFPASPIRADSQDADGHRNEIRVELHSDDDHHVILAVRDNGVGFPEGVDFRNTESLGLQLVNTLAQQLDGTVDLVSNDGTTFKVTFPLPDGQEPAADARRPQELR